MRVQTIFLVVVIFLAALVAGYQLTQAALTVTAAAPVTLPAKAPLSVQATTVSQVAARGEAAEITPALFEDTTFNYRLSYPAAWSQVQVSTNVVAFQSPDGDSSVRVEAVGPLPAEGLTAFVNRSLGDTIVISRQSLTVHGWPAERVVAFSDKVNGQVTTFFIDAGASAYVISGVGRQKAIEAIARSFDAAEQLVLR